MEQLAMKNASFLDAVKTVLYGFVGVRRKADHEAARIRPAHVIAIGIIFVVLFVLALRTIVGMITS